MHFAYYYLFGLISAALSASQSPLPSLVRHSSVEAIVPTAFFVRAPGDIGCNFPRTSGIAIGFASKPEVTRHRKGDKFLVLLPTGETRVAEMPDPKKTVICTPELAGGEINFVYLKVDSPFTWPTDEGFKQALIAIEGSKLGHVRIGTILRQKVPEAAEKELERLFSNDKKGVEVTHSAQIIAPPGLKNKYAFIHTQVFPKDYATAGDGAVTHQMSFWKIEDSRWKFISKSPGNLQAFSITSLSGNGVFQIGVSENEKYSGRYDLREFNGGVPTEVIQNFFSWMD